jgi:V/A-type H+-transporting ATPase subunit D
MERLAISVTKSNLIRMREELHFAREGKELLTQKREVLVMELMHLLDDSVKVREDLESLLAEAYGAFAKAVLLDGFDGIRRLVLGIAERSAPHVEERSVMGVMLPIVTGTSPGWEPAPEAADRAGRLFSAVADKLLEAAEVETAIYRLAIETRKTLRRERALENYFIPQYQQTVHFLQESLEEKERESFYQLKLSKERRP